MKRYYFDYAAAAPMKPEVLEAMRPFWSGEFYNPSAVYLPARAVKAKLEDARRRTATQLGARPAEIVFTAGATEANNLAVQGIARQFPDGKILVSSVEHESVAAPAALCGAKEIPVDGQGRIILNKLSKLITDMTVLISIILVNNETGAIQPLAEAAKLVAAERRRRQAGGNKLPIYLHTDAAQAGNYLDLHVSRLGVDLMSLNGGKIYGPKQSGALYIRAGVSLQPLILGGGQEFNLRSGTENLAAIRGFVAALEMAQAGRREESRRLNGLREDLESRLKTSFPDVIINGPPGHKAPHIISATFEGQDNERLVMELDERGLLCAAGSACSAGSEEPSHTLLAMGLNEAQARGTLRFSLGAETGQDDVDYLVETLRGLLANR